jgi:hypothetical protein
MSAPIEPDDQFNKSLQTLPSIVLLGLSHVPRKIDKSLFKRWANLYENAPRTGHTPQRFLHPQQKLERLPLNLDHHTNCGAHTGAIHSTVTLAIKVSEERARRLTTGASRADISMELGKTMVMNLRARAEAERDVGKVQDSYAELDKRHWLQTVMEARSNQHSRRFHESRNAHASLGARNTGDGMSSPTHRRSQVAQRRATSQINRMWKHVPVDPALGPPPYFVAPPRKVDSPRQTATLSPREGGVGFIKVMSPHVMNLLTTAETTTTTTSS